jgi:hypothetical protein
MHYHILIINNWKLLIKYSKFCLANQYQSIEFFHIEKKNPRNDMPNTLPYLLI